MDPASLTQIESLCEVFYNQPSNPDWAAAKAQVDSMSASPEHIPQCQYILDNSQNPYAQLLASSVLKTLITTYWNNFEKAQHITIREYLLQFLAEKGPTIPPFVLGALISLLCRITKLGWFDDAKHREIVTELTRFLSASVDHCIVGLRALNLLIQEMNVPLTGRTLTIHRKTAVSFRDSSLLDIAMLAVEVLNQVSTDSMNASATQQVSLGEQSLEIVCGCLGFDFIGTNPDESAEDVGTIQVPSTWRELVQSPSTVELLLLFYRSTEPPVSNLAMRCLVQLSSVRRSIFLNDNDRLAFLSSIMNAIGDVLKNGTGLEHSDNYHEFCRLLGRLKANYQLSELIADDKFLEWLELVGVFTETSFRQWQVSANSLGYILQLWVRLVAAVPYVGENSQAPLAALQDCVVRVSIAYTESMLNSCTTCLEDDSIENPLENESLMLEQLERLSSLVRFRYASLFEFIVSRFDPLLMELPDLLAKSSHPNPRLELVEAQLSFLTYLSGSIVGAMKWGVGNSYAQSNNTSKEGPGVERLDGLLSKRAFRVSQIVDYHSESTGRLCSERLEQSSMFFQINFRKTYLSDAPVAAVQTMLMTSGLSDLSWDAEGGAMTVKQRATRTMLEALELGDQNEVTNLVMTKVFSNFRRWQSSHGVLKDSMTLFVDLASGANCSKVLMQLPCCHTLLSHHTPEHFPFLVDHENRHLRSQMHQTLAKLIFMQPVDRIDSAFASFIKPIQQVLSDVASLPPNQLRSDSRVREALQGCCRDLRGICSAATSKKSYLMLLNSLYPNHVPFFTRAVEVFYDDSDVMIALLKCMGEIVTNTSQRASFGNNSAQGILLFREAASVAHAFASSPPRTLSPSADLYKERYKLVACCLRIIKESLSGGYVNFGVMALYGDSALQLSLDACLTTLLSVPIEDTLSYPKLSTCYFSSLETLFNEHMAYMAEKDPGTFMKLLEILFGGIQADLPVSSFSSQAIDHITTYIVTNRETTDQSKAGTVSALQLHLSSNPRLLPDLTAKLFELILFGAQGSMWAVTRPVLSLFLADESVFHNYRQHLLGTQSPENQGRLGDCFDRLLMDLDPSLDIANRDRFAQRLANFRSNVREFLTL